jgi:thiol-disulfide isomerase/thioredoxin
MGSHLGLLAISLAVVGVGNPEQPTNREDTHETERRIITYVKENLKPGEPLVLSQLYNEVFTSPEEREVLSKLNGVFFRVPLFVLEYQADRGELPTLDEISAQFDFYGPEEADVVLAVMESDPRVPNFIRRDPETRQIVELDIDKVKGDPRFNKILERSLSWEGKPAPAVGGRSFEGAELSLASLRGKAVLLYVWFTDCPPCVRMAPELVALQNEYAPRGFTILGANADRVLDLPYDDKARAEYVEKHSINYPSIHLSEEDRAALGNVNIFPTMFLVDPNGVIVKYYVNYQSRDVLERDISQVLASSVPSSP